MIVTTSELKQNLKQYLQSSEKEDVLISRNGKIIAKIVNPYSKQLDILHSLRGSLKTTMDEKQIREERTKNL